MSGFTRMLARMVFGRSAAQEETIFGLWTRAALECGVENLVRHRMSLLDAGRIEGVRWPLTLRIAPMGAGGSATAVITVGGLPERIELKHESLGTSALRMVGGDEIELGDPEFDTEFFLRGDPLEVRGVFDAATRRKALLVFGRRQTAAAELFKGADRTPPGITNGQLVTRFVDGGFPHPPVTPAELLGYALDIAGRLVRDPGDEHLADVIRHDPVTAVRMAALTLLRRERPRHPETIAALEAVCTDHDQRIRLAAAQALGVTRARDTLVDLASRANVPDEVSAGAIAELRSHLPAEQAQSILEEALEKDREQTACACVETLSRIGPFAALLMRVLAEEGDTAVGLAAIRGLGRCGTPSEVELLLEMRARYARNAAFAEAARGAVAAIQGRQSGSAGQLALATDDRGRLSVPEEVGQVSLTDDEG